MKQTILYIDAGHGGLDPMTGEYLTPPSDGKKCQHNNGKAYHGNGWFYEGHFNRQIASEFIKEKLGLMEMSYIYHLQQQDK